MVFGILGPSEAADDQIRELALGDRKRRSVFVTLRLAWGSTGERGSRAGIGPMVAFRPRQSRDAPRGRTQASAVASWWRWSVRRLWVACTNRHSAFTAARPRRWKRSSRRLNFVSANTGSTIALASAIELTPELAFEHPAHERVHPVVPAGTRIGSFARVGRHEHLGAADGDVLHLHPVSVPGVSQRDLRTLGHADRLKLAFRGGDHRLEMTEVGSRS